MAKTKQQEAVIIKGVGSGLLILLDDKEDWQRLLGELDQRIRENEGFFKGAQATVNVSGRTLDDAQIAALQALLEPLTITLATLVSGSAATREAATARDLEARPPSFTRAGSRQAHEEEAVPLAEPEFAAFNLLEIAETERAALFIRRTLRSGQRVQHEGNVCIVGDVNAGAEIMAGGHVLVWGILRGLVHAGVNGDSEATICALQLEPTQLRIAEAVGRGAGPQSGQRIGLLRRLRRGKAEAGGPECASVREGQIVVESWNGNFGKRGSVNGR